MLQVLLLIECVYYIIGSLLQIDCTSLDGGGCLTGSDEEEAVDDNTYWKAISLSKIYLNKVQNKLYNKHLIYVQATIIHNYDLKCRGGKQVNNILWINKYRRFYIH